MKFLTERQMQKNALLADGDYISTKDVLNRIAKFIPNKQILAELDNEKNIVYHTALNIFNDVENLGDALLSLGLEDKHIAISAENSYLYVVCDLAISGGVGVVTPIDRDAPCELLVTLLNKCEADAIICSHYVYEKVKLVQKDCPNLKTIIFIDKPEEGFEDVSSLIEKGKTIENKIYHNKELNLNAPAKLLFTSGTTGANKLVCLTQNNLSANIINCMDTIKAKKGNENTSMSVLPMHHATEINTHIMSRIASGRLTYINDSMKNMMNNIKIFQPTVITIVPMIANAFYSNIWLNAKKVGKDKKLKKGIKLCKLCSLFGIDITHKLLKDVFVPFGGNLTEIVCGGAVLNPEMVKGLRDLGIFVINGYGVTECGPLVSMNTETIKEVYSVGKPAPGIEAKIVNANEEGVGELCVRGKSVVDGYYKDEYATQQSFYDDGFFNTGDLAKIDKKGRIFLTGRKKNAIVLENGKNICPEEIENELANALPYVKDVVVYSAEFGTENNKHNLLCAGLFIEDEQIRKDKERIANDVKKVNKILTNYKRIAYVNLPETEYEKTALRKVKRIYVLEKHNGETGIKL